MYSLILDIPNLGPTTSLVFPTDEWDDFMDSMTQIGLLGPKDLAAIKLTKHLPLMAAGTLTQAVFDKYEVKTQYLTACERGLFERMQAVEDN